MFVLSVKVMLLEMVMLSVKVTFKLSPLQTGLQDNELMSKLRW